MTPKSVALALVTVSLPLVLCSVTGCAQDEYEAREAAFPQPIGYTPPPSAPPPAPLAQPSPVALPSQESPQGQDAAEVVVGADGPSDGTPAAGGVVTSDGTPAAGDVVNSDNGQQAPEPEYSDADPSALTDFRAALDPYGTWTEDPTYGTVWVPSPSAVGEDFTPYVSAGHWVYDDDYTWVSDYGWGWAPFHYGRWAWDRGLGWEWIPGRRYAGAWVSWRYGTGDWGYVGWAPLGPTWCWRHGSAVGLGFVPRMPYGFVGRGELFSPHVGARLVSGPQAGVVAAHTQPYAPASPTVGGRIAARPTVGGPPPAMLNLAPSAVAHGSVANRGTMLARAYARPSTAIAQGASSPGRFAGSVTLGRSPVVNYSPPASSFRPRSDFAGEVPSHFGGRLGGGFAGTAVANAPGYGRALSPAVSRPYFGTPAVAPTSSYGPRSGGAGDVPSRAPSGSVSQAPRFSSAPSYRAPVYSAGVSRPSGGYSGGFSRPSGGYSGGFSRPSGGYSSGFSHSSGGSSGGFHAGGGSSFHSGGGGSRGGGGRR